MSKTVEGADPQASEIRELSLHEYELVAGGDGDGDGDNSEASGNNPDVNNPGSSGGSLQNGNNTRAGDNNNGN